MKMKVIPSGGGATKLLKVGWGATQLAPPNSNPKIQCARKQEASGAHHAGVWKH